MGCPADDTPELDNKVVPAKDHPASGRSPVSPEEGADLIRGFLQIEQKNVRAAIIELVKRLAQASSRT